MAWSSPAVHGADIPHERWYVGPDLAPHIRRRNRLGSGRSGAGACPAPVPQQPVGVREEWGMGCFLTGMAAGGMLPRHSRTPPRARLVLLQGALVHDVWPSPGRCSGKRQRSRDQCESLPAPTLKREPPPALDSTLPAAAGAVASYPQASAGTLIARGALGAARSLPTPLMCSLALPTVRALSRMLARSLVPPLLICISVPCMLCQH
jgi:hypothetical protein